MTAPSDKELRRLRALCEIDDVDLVPSEGIAIIDELLAARKVVRATSKLLEAVTTVAFDDAAHEARKALEAYDKVRKGKGA